MAARMAASPGPSHKAEEQGVAAAAGPEALAALSAAKMRCGGCGGKVRQQQLNLHDTMMQYICMQRIKLISLRLPKQDSVSFSILIVYFMRHFCITPYVLHFTGPVCRFCYSVLLVMLKNHKVR